MKFFSILYLSFMITFFSCSKEIMIPSESFDAVSIFEEFWTYVDEHYIYFREKGVDWDEVRERYLSLVSRDMTDVELFDLCQDALMELRDNHNRLQSSFSSARKYPYFADFEVHFSIDVVRDQYAGGRLTQEGDLFYGMIAGDLGYIFIQDMDRFQALPAIMRQMKEEGAKGIIIDIRSNRGGDSNPFIEMISELITEPLTVGYYIEKSGPGHEENTDPIPVRSTPSADFYLNLPIALITDRESYSASSYMAAMYKAVPGVTVVGQLTGGGGGGNNGYQLSNGWIIAVSMSDFLDAEMQSIESGVEPDVFIENTAEGISAGRDDMLEKAIDILQ